MGPLALLPEIVLVAGALLALILSSFLPRTRQWVTRIIALAALLLGLIVAAGESTGGPVTVLGDSFAIDGLTTVARIVVAVGTGLVIGLGIDELTGDRRESETYALLLLGAAGVAVVAGAADLLVLAVGFLLSSIPLYAIIGLTRTRAAAEAALKTYLLGTLSSITLLLGVTILFGVAAATTYAQLTIRLGTAPSAAVAAGVVAVLGGLLFKAGAVPLHFWVPDAAQGCGAIAAAFLTTVPKIGALVAVYRFVGTLPGSIAWPLVVATLAVISMTVGNLAAYGQDDPRRLLGWSTVSQVGYLLVPIAVVGRSDLARPALLFYLAAYAVTNLAAFAVAASVPERHLDDYRGLATTRPCLAAALLVSLLGLVGTPPTAVFVGKLAVAVAAWDGGAPWLAVAVVANTVASLFYYLRWITPTYQRPGVTDRSPAVGDHPPRWAPRMALVSAAASLALGLAAGALAALTEVL